MLLFCPIAFIEEQISGFLLFWKSCFREKICSDTLGLILTSPFCDTILQNYISLFFSSEISFHSVSLFNHFGTPGGFLVSTQNDCNYTEK